MSDKQYRNRGNITLIKKVKVLQMLPTCLNIQWRFVNIATDINWNDDAISTSDDIRRHN